jgi:hypothetical protein
MHCREKKKEYIPIPYPAEPKTYMAVHEVLSIIANPMIDLLDHVSRDMF